MAIAKLFAKLNFVKKTSSMPYLKTFNTSRVTPEVLSDAEIVIAYQKMNSRTRYISKKRVTN